MDSLFDVNTAINYYGIICAQMFDIINNMLEADYGPYDDEQILFTRSGVEFEEWNKPVNTIEDAIAQREQWFQRYGNGFPEEVALSHYFNNFFFCLPVDNITPHAWGYYRNIHRILGKMDISFGEQLDKTEYSLRTMSDLKKSQTPAQFYAAIDRVLVEEGISLEKVVELQKDQTRRFEMLRLCQPAFDRLRTMYSYNDLIT